MATNWMSKILGDHGMISSSVKQGHIVSTPSPSLNWAAGNGGFESGKTVLLAGPESAGKSLIMYLSFVEILKKDPDALVCLFDSERSFNPEWFKKLGGDPNRVALYQTKDPTKIFDFIYGPLLTAIQDGAPIKSIGIDSLRAIIYPNDNKKTSTDQTMGGAAAKYLEPVLKRVTDICADNKILFFLIQQVYQELDQYKAKSDPWIIPGGIALRHMSDYILIVTRQLQQKNRIEDGSNITGGAQTVGHRVKAFFKKNKVSNPFRLAEFTLHYNLGVINTEAELYDLAKSLGVVFHPINPDTKKASPQMWQIGNYPIIKGEANFKQWFIEQTSLHKEFLKLCGSVSTETVVQRNLSLGISNPNDIIDKEQLSTLTALSSHDELEELKNWEAELDV